MKRLLAAAALLFAASCIAQTSEVVDLPTRAGVTERMLVLSSGEPKAAVILLAGGQGRVRIGPTGETRNQNFLVRSRNLFAQQGLAAVVVDTPSDHPNGMTVAFRESDDHVSDVVAAIEWARKRWSKPVWLVGTSRGTQSAVYVAKSTLGTRDSPDGIVLSSSILARSRRDPGTPVQEQGLQGLRIPVLVVHHEADPCPICAPSLLRELKLPANSKVVMETGGISTGDPCEAFAYHGYNGIEGKTVADIAAFINDHPVKGQ